MDRHCLKKTILRVRYIYMLWTSGRVCQLPDPGAPPPQPPRTQKKPRCRRSRVGGSGYGAARAPQGSPWYLQGPTRDHPVVPTIGPRCPSTSYSLWSRRSRRRVRADSARMPPSFTLVLLRLSQHSLGIRARQAMPLHRIITTMYIRKEAFRQVPEPGLLACLTRGCYVTGSGPSGW